MEREGKKKRCLLKHLPHMEFVRWARVLVTTVAVSTFMLKPHQKKIFL